MSDNQYYQLGSKAIIRRSTGEVLCLRAVGFSGGWYWDLPGGRVQENETPRAALDREVQEETGLCIVTAEEKGIFCTNLKKLTPKGEVRLLLVGYECGVENEKEICLSEEHDEWEWLSAVEATIRLRAAGFPEKFLDLLSV